MANELHNKSVLIMGLGRFGGGAGAAQYCLQQGVRVHVTDQLPASQLANALKLLEGLPITFRLGEHLIKDFTEADLIIVNPAVGRSGNRYLDAALAAGVSLSSEIQLLIDRLPTRTKTIGITGTAGKSTTVAMIGHILTHCLGQDRVHVGGNIGGSLLGKLDEIAADHWVVLELSSFMLEYLEGFSPHIAAVTNISNNHLDRHKTMANYTAAKQNILAQQEQGDIAILGESVKDWLLQPGVMRTVIAEPVEPVSLPIPGEHNQLNAAFAIAVVQAATHLTFAQCAQSLANFTGLPHRMQLVATQDGVRYINDSKSTTPESAILAMSAFEKGAVHAILGGYDKQADLTEMVDIAIHHCAAIYAIGQTAERIAVIASQIGDGCDVLECKDLSDAVQRCQQNAQSGQTVLLSPGCASWGQFDNFEHRGELFTQLALGYTIR